MNRLTALMPAPSEQEIAKLEKQLSEMKAAREQAKKRIQVDIQSVVDEIPNALRVDQIIRLMAQLNKKLKSTRRRTRGSPVSDEIKQNLVDALKLNKYSLAELHNLFGLSISYISRIKHELGLTQPKAKAQVQDVPQHDGVAQAA